MSLTNNEKQLIKQSYTQITSATSNFAAIFYDCLFELAPLIRPMFVNERNVFEQHFNEIIATAVDKVNDFETIEESLLQLGRIHRNFGVNIGQFKVVKNALLLSIQYTLKQQCNEEIEQAWSHYYDCIAAVMIRGLETE
ncbi:hypothetical protein TUM4644_17120 [Shewanella colwelliana]|uniref:Globin domain-containing protein n=1 Tax=Shewanella colwelliana TaxID=23 RepID=A0A1E5ING7_SHECO|nr:globin domain-containing protein [Shewanella colwelliana]MDX1280389.1 globin domain-containing protein [Shewanella colwelliana]OEG72070.1 hypothetical protein BEL05_03480 [Shewanella colwelliana]GIU23528.1 hypothetical protein TUM4644_17120 [Shewanella colwelliana]GIU39650.1 hypothetical protein TUM3794_15240 [Shewanella colwelliana]